ncbi:MAG: hypothetical protein NTX33_06380 [Propionibacteriales bacterium]|nr:hypothetical protein [Propionibacteriales bacterium]
MDSDQWTENAGCRDGAAGVDLAALLGRAAGGDASAFLAFYDRTVPIIFRYALAGCRGDRDAAVSLTRVIYREAWRTADQQFASGLSPLAWLIAGGCRQDPSRTITEHAC